MRKTRWQIQNKLKLDKLQTKLTAKGCEPNILKTATIPFLQQKFYICPFCLNRNEPKNFIILLPKGKIRKGLGKCPFCSNQIQWQTLMKIREMTIQEFAYWCFEYSLNGFWEKVNYKSFNQNLNAMNLSQKFWNYYKELKGTYNEEKPTIEQAQQITKEELESLHERGLISDDYYEAMLKNGVKH